MLIDLQLHSTYSDGYLSPTELVDFISKKNIKIASLTDHNTVRGQHEFKHACQKAKIKPITGLELYAKLNSKKMNLLWFNFDPCNPELHNVLRESQIRRRVNVRKHLEIIERKLKLKLDINKIIDQYNHYIAINHIVDDIWKVQENRPRIKRFLKNKTPREDDIIRGLFYNSKLGNKMLQSYISIDRIITLRKKIGGQIILNHPAKHHSLKEDFLLKLKTLGIDGIEVLSPHHSIRSVMYLQSLARKLNLIETGGSDFHRFEGGKFAIQSAFEYHSINHDLLKGINKIIT